MCIRATFQNDLNRLHETREAAVWLKVSGYVGYDFIARLQLGTIDRYRSRRVRFEQFGVDAVMDDGDLLVELHRMLKTLPVRGADAMIGHGQALQMHAISCLDAAGCLKVHLLAVRKPDVGAARMVKPFEIAEQRCLWPHLFQIESSPQPMWATTISG